MKEFLSHNFYFSEFDNFRLIFKFEIADDNINYDNTYNVDVDSSNLK